MPKFKRKTKLKLHKPSMETVMQWIVTLLLGFIVLLPAFAGVTQYEQNRAKADAEDVLAFMQTSCRKYDNYRLGATTEALQDVLNKVKTLTAYPLRRGRCAFKRKPLTALCEISVFDRHFCFG